MSAAPHRRIEIVEVLRGLAAFAVAWYHFTNGGPLLKDGWVKWTGSFGWMGVEVFFVISGFVIPYSMLRGGYRFPRHVGPYLAKRFIRLEPPYLASIAIALGLWYLSALAPGFQGEAPRFDVQQLMYHVGYMAGFFDYPWIIPVFWSLAIEFQFYFAMALLFPLLLGRSLALRIAALLLFVALGHVVPSDLGLFHYASLFALGILTLWKHEGAVGNAGYLALVAIAGVGGLDQFPAPIIVVAGVAAIVMAFVEVPRIPLLAGLGAISYSLYLLHVPVGGRVVNLGARLGDTAAVHALVLAAAVTASIAAGYLLFRFVEKPARQLSGRIRYGRDPA